MKIAYNPGEALVSAPSDDIIFDLAGKAIFARGCRFDGKLHTVFKKEQSNDGIDGLVPFPNYNDGSSNRFLKEDGTWEVPYTPIQINGVPVQGDEETVMNLIPKDFIKLNLIGRDVEISTTYEVATPEKDGLMSSLDKIKLDYLNYDSNSFSGNLTDAFTQVIAGGNTISSNINNQSLSINQGLGINITSDTNSQSILIEGIVMTGATTDSVGTSGLVPAPSNSDINSFLKGDGTWGGYSLVTQTHEGLMSKDDKKKLDHLSYGPDFDGILDNAFNQVSAGGITLESKNNQCLSISPGLGINITADESSQTVSILGVVMTGANGSDGESGLVPKPSYGDSNKYLKGNGSWDDSIRHSINSDNATNADNADTVDGWHISVGSAGSEPNTIYFVL